MLKFSGSLIWRLGTRSSIRNFASAGATVQKTDKVDVTGVHNKAPDTPGDDKDNTGLVAAAFASLNSPESDDLRKPSPKSAKTSRLQQLDGQITKATDVNSLLLVAENPVVSRRHALKMVSVLSEWSSANKIKLADFEKDPRFLKLCRILARTHTAQAMSSLTMAEDLSTVLGITGDDEAARLISNLSLPQMVKVMKALHQKGRRSTPLLRALAHNIVKQTEVIDLKKSADLLYCMAALNFPDPVLMDRICKDVIECLPSNEDRPAVVTSMLMSLGLLKYRHEACVGALCEWTVKHAAPQPLASAIITLATLHYVPPAHEKLFQMALRLKEEEMAKASTWLDLVFSLLVLGKAAPHHLASTLQPEFIDKLLSAGEIPIPSRRKLMAIDSYVALTASGASPPRLGEHVSVGVPVMHTKEKALYVHAIMDTFKSLVSADSFLKKDVNSGMGFLYDRGSPGSILASDICRDHIWIQNEDRHTSGVKIVELRSSDSGKSPGSTDDDKDYFPDHNHQWSYAKQGNGDDYKINEASREERRRRQRDDMTMFDASTSEYDDDFLYTEVFVTGSCDTQNESVVYNQVNCFTILDKHLRDSDSSNEDYGDIEVINCNDTNQEWASDCRNYDADIIKCEPETENEKRTVWIYSFKNKHVLSENDYELINIPSQDGSLSSVEDYQPCSIDNGACRVSSPVPLYVPRLHLPSTPPLPTVTEVTEPGRQSSANQTEGPSIKKTCFRENNWCISENIATTQVTGAEDKSTSIVNWMSLSPREKRRRFRNASPINLPLDMMTDRLPTLNEVSSQVEKSEEMNAKQIMKTFISDVSTDNCECGDIVMYGGRDKGTVTDENMQSTISLNRSRISALERLGSGILDSAKKSVRTIKSNLASTRTSVSRSNNEITVENEQHGLKSPNDRGDHLPSSKPRPHIKISAKPNSRIITDPMENIASDNWIFEEKLIKDDRIRRPQNAKGDSASDALWVRNMALLKPAEWSEFEPIFAGESIPSLHLSVNTDSVEENQTLCRRILRYFNCCT